VIEEDRRRGCDRGEATLKQVGCGAGNLVAEVSLPAALGGDGDGEAKVTSAGGGRPDVVGARDDNQPCSLPSANRQGICCSCATAVCALQNLCVVMFWFCPPSIIFILEC
jgi:hypothetical protein